MITINWCIPCIVYASMPMPRVLSFCDDSKTYLFLRNCNISKFTIIKNKFLKNHVFVFFWGCFAIYSCCQISPFSIKYSTIHVHMNLTFYFNKIVHLMNFYYTCKTHFDRIFVSKVFFHLNVKRHKIQILLLFKATFRIHFSSKYLHKFMIRFAHKKGLTVVI